MSPIVVLGYDVRTPLSPAAASSTADVRAKFFLRPEIASPASVDRAVWPGAIAMPAETNPVNLWNSISAILRISPSLAKPGARDPMLIEVGVITNDESAPYWRRTFYGYVGVAEDSYLKEGYEELGFD